MIRLIHLPRSSENLRAVRRRNFTSSLLKAFVNNSDEEKTKLSHSAVLSSPGCLLSSDFKEVRKWLTASKHFHLIKTAIDTDAVEMVAPEKPYKILAKVAFKTLFQPFRSVTDPDNNTETMLLYYTGIGLPVKQAEEITKKPTFPSPNLDPFGISKEKLAPAARYIKPKRPLKGGEFDLGELGYCDLGGILEPWITALTKSPRKKNKHLVIVADSCYSGMLVEDLQQLALKEGPWNHDGCSVTVQSACSSDEVNFVGRFTPCFIHFNKPENRGGLHVLKRKWNRKSEEEKNMYRQLNLPSPQLATTMPSDQLDSDTDSPTMKFPHIIGGDGFPLTLFRDAGFFKFCYLNHLEIVGSVVPGTPTLKHLILLLVEIVESTWEFMANSIQLLSVLYRITAFIIAISLRWYQSLVETIRDLSKWLKNREE